MATKQIWRIEGRVSQQDPWTPFEGQAPVDRPNPDETAHYMMGRCLSLGLHSWRVVHIATNVQVVDGRSHSSHTSWRLNWLQDVERIQQQQAYKTPTFSNTTPGRAADPAISAMVAFQKRMDEAQAAAAAGKGMKSDFDPHDDRRL